jgi:hypothetical protein
MTSDLYKDKFKVIYLEISYIKYSQNYNQHLTCFRKKNITNKNNNKSIK